MGIDVSHSLLVGCSYGELEDFIEKELDGHVAGIAPSEVLEGYFDTASPYYDAPTDECFYGLRIPNHHEVDEWWFVEVQKISSEFEKLTGVKPRIRGGAHVW